MAFPVSPTIGDTHSISGNSWIWNGFAWDKSGISGAVTYLNDLSDVTITSVTGGDVLYFNSSTNNWINKPIDTINIDGGTY